jgi:glycerol-3-phosphate dehydrogenase (NAD(P)+)
VSGVDTRHDATVGVLGAGSWGTALAIQLARAGRTTWLWGRSAEHLSALGRDRRNARYLPDAPFPAGLEVEADLARVLAIADILVLAVPSHAVRALLQEIAPQLRRRTPIAWASKGLEHPQGKLLHEVAAEVLGPEWPVAVLSGPTFASEVAKALPTAITVASTHAGFAHELATILSSESFRAYTSSDIIGVEVGGAVKNVLAIGTGIADGLGLGANTRVALITRGLVEMTRLGVAVGARRETLSGLAGLGDLVLTCTDDQSRNRRFGLALAAGLPVNAAQEQIQQVVEGVQGARAVREISRRAGVEMPICEQVYQVIHEGLAPRQAVHALMTRALKPESA